MTLEAYGLCPKGDRAELGERAASCIGGKLPLNTSGGLLSETGMPGLQLVIEAVRQMRGTSPNCRPGGPTCVVSNQGGTMHTHSTLILAG